MNKKFILPVSLMLLVGLAVFVSAESQNSDIKLKLQKGWNLISLYVLDNSIDELTKSGTMKYAYFYDKENNQYIRLYPDKESNKMHKFLGPEAKRGAYLNAAVWVYSDRNFETIPAYIDNPEPLDLIEISKGWNFVAVTRDMIDKNLGSIKGSCNIQKIASWDEITQKWESIDSTSYSKNMPSNVNVMWDDVIVFEKYQLGEGVLFKVSSDCKLATGGSSATPPTIPN